MQVYIVDYATRAHSSGDENRRTKVFSTLIGAYKYLLKIFETYGVHGDRDDLYTDSSCYKHARQPTMKLAEKLFNPTALQAFLDKPNDKNIIYGPWSEYCSLVPFEILFTTCTLDDYESF